MTETYLEVQQLQLVPSLDLAQNINEARSHAMVAVKGVNKLKTTAFASYAIVRTLLEQRYGDEVDDVIDQGFAKVALMGTAAIADFAIMEANMATGNVHSEGDQQRARQFMEMATGILSKVSNMVGIVLSAGAAGVQQLGAGASPGGTAAVAMWRSVGGTGGKLVCI